MLARPGGPELDGYFVVRRNFFSAARSSTAAGRPTTSSACSAATWAATPNATFTPTSRSATPTGKPATSGRLKAKLDHITCAPDGLNRYFQRFNRYTTQAAERYHREGRKPYIWNFFLHPGWEFFKMYILKLGFLDGIPGLAVCSFCAFTRFVRYMKLYASIQRACRRRRLRQGHDDVATDRRRERREAERGMNQTAILILNS